GSALTDFQTRKKKEIYDNKTGKSILFYVSASMLYDHGMSGLEKMKQAYEMLGDFDVVFLQDKYAGDILDDMPEVLGAYEKWLDEAPDSDRVKVITEISENTVESVDGYYGDAGIAMHRCRMAGKAFLMETPGKTVEDEALGTFLSDVMSRDYSVEVTDFGRKILEML
ncbi:MAG: hypothetical protein K5639_07145, partial [Eubacterium sp.]|nr:hypothetical protein [Eubacterium sp.]